VGKKIIEKTGSVIFFFKLDKFFSLILADIFSLKNKDVEHSPKEKRKKEAK
jgi:hypothetical protein